MSAHHSLAGGLALVFVNVLAEQLGAPVPSYPALLVAGSLATPSPGDAAYLASVWLVAMLACEIADSTWYWLGRRYGGWSMAQVCRISLEPDTCIRRNRNLYQRVGPRLLIVAKLVPGLAALSTLMAGATRTPYRVFLLYDGIGSALWVASGLVLGVLFQHAILRTLAWLEQYAVAGALIILGGLGLLLAIKTWRRRRIVRRSRAIPRMTAETLVARQNAGETLQILDVREPSVVTATIPGAVAVPIDTPRRAFTRLSPDLPTVIFCACPNEVTAALVGHRLRAAGFGDVHALIGGVEAWRDHAGARPAFAARPLVPTAAQSPGG